MPSRARQVIVITEGQGWSSSSATGRALTGNVLIVAVQGRDGEAHDQRLTGDGAHAVDDVLLDADGVVRPQHQQLVSDFGLDLVFEDRVNLDRLLVVVRSNVLCFHHPNDADAALRHRHVREDLVPSHVLHCFTCSKYVAFAISYSSGTFMSSKTTDVSNGTSRMSPACACITARIPAVASRTSRSSGARRLSNTTGCPRLPSTAGAAIRAFTRRCSSRSRRVTQAGRGWSTLSTTIAVVPSGSAPAATRTDEARPSEYSSLTIASAPARWTYGRTSSARCPSTTITLSAPASRSCATWYSMSVLPPQSSSGFGVPIREDSPPARSMATTRGPVIGRAPTRPPR